jgi:hypothetical protein
MEEIEGEGREAHKKIRVEASHHVSNWTVEVEFCPFPVAVAVAVSELQLGDQEHRVQSLPLAGVAEPLGSSLRTGRSSMFWAAKVRSAGSSSP